MAKFDVEFYSKVLIRPVSFKVYIPNDSRGELPQDEYHNRPMKTLFLLHGYTGNASFWGYEGLAEKYNFAMVMPNGENAFYMDTISSCGKYCTFVGKELVEYMRKTFGLCMSAEDTFISGMSMGGFGSFHIALAYPENFGKIGAMSSALIIHGVAHMKPGEDNGVANYEYYRYCFGELDKVEESEANPEVQLLNLRKAGRKIPEIYFCCGTEDFLIEPNRQFDRFLTENGFDHVYVESAGVHDDKFWNEYEPKIMEWMFK